MAAAVPVAAVAGAAVTPVAQVLGICGANASQMFSFETTEQLNDRQDYADMSTSEPHNMALGLGKRTVADGKCIILTKIKQNV
jgi:hypothetical protein